MYYSISHTPPNTILKHLVCNISLAHHFQMSFSILSYRSMFGGVLSLHLLAPQIFYMIPDDIFHCKMTTPNIMSYCILQYDSISTEHLIWFHTPSKRVLSHSFPTYYLLCHSLLSFNTISTVRYSEVSSYCTRQYNYVTP